MSVTFPSPIFGPIHSRRLGISLGINLLPGDGKLCSFDCIYCECGFNHDHRTRQALPTREEVYTALEKKLKEMRADGTAPNVLTFAGNGEPTAHPSFDLIIEDTIELRNKYFPEAKVSVLSNSTFLHRRAVIEALKKVDNNILKLDTVDLDYIKMVDRPAGPYDVDKIIDYIKEFDGKYIIQTMFMKGTFDGQSVDNTTDKYVLPWISRIKEIAPQQVMIYTIDRETPGRHLEKATHADLDRIVRLLEQEGIQASASY